jgi:CheY-like chemotaxis protein
MIASQLERNPRILIVDDNRAIHDDFKKILCPSEGQAAASELADEAAALFGEPAASKDPGRQSPFEIDSAYQGRQGLEVAVAALQQGRPHALAFVDVRMPPGWDGIETTMRLWEAHPDLQIVICTAYSDYSWEEMAGKLGHSDQLLVLKKPFETMEVMQLAEALTEKWRLLQGIKLKVDQLEKLVAERTRVLRETNAKLESANQELKDAMARIKTLGGLLPICAHCKKIRDDKGYWQQIELFIRDHSNANFSHGICPGCAHEFFPGLCPEHAASKVV